MSGLIRGINQTIRQSLIDVRFSTSTLEFRFRVIVTAPQMMHDKIFDATEALAAAGCDDASIGGHEEGMELLLEQSADALQSAAVQP